MRSFLAIVVLALVSDAGALPLFEDESILEIKLSGPLSSLLDLESDRDQIVFSLHADSSVHSVKARLRGQSRREVCDFPPIRINFNNNDTEQTLFQGQDKLKLVTHCRKSDAAEFNLLMEYAAYRIFNLVSDVSYRVRLLRITYEDTDGQLKESTFERYGFLIESSSELADRVAGKPMELAGVSLRSLNQKQAASVFVFQFLIANTDWSLVTADTSDTCCHNGHLFDVESGTNYVPYDFDQSGLVNAKYARPDPALKISRVTKRVYRGYCIPTDALRDALGSIKAQRADILDVVSGVPGLSEKYVETKTKFLERFFERADNEDKLLKYFSKKCL